MKYLNDFSLTVLLSFIMFPLGSFAQEKDYTCRIFEQIAKDMYHDKQQLESLKNLSVVTDPNTLKRQLLPFGNRTQKEVDSIIRIFDSLSDIDLIRQVGDSLLIVDSFNFFNSRCNCFLGKTNFVVAKNIKGKKNSLSSKTFGVVASIGTKEDNLIVTILFPEKKCYVNYYFTLKFNNIKLVSKKRLPVYVE